LVPNFRLTLAEEEKAMGNMRRRDFLKLGMASGASLFAVQAPAAVPAQSTTPKRGGVFSLAMTDTFMTFNPMAGRWYRIRRTLYNSLAHYDESMNLVPELAEKWAFSADGRSITFRLREGVTFHSGRPFTSADVKATWEFAIADEAVLQRPMYKAVIKDIETPEKYIAVLKMERPNATVYDLIDSLQIVDRETVADFAKVGIGTGPFKVERYVPNDRIEMVAFADYWDKGKPYVQKHVSHIIPDASAMITHLEAGAVDCVRQPNLIDAVRLRAPGSKFTVDMRPYGALIFNVGFNTKLAPFTNKKVRQAVGCCIDRERFSRSVLQGLSQPTCLIWPDSHWAYLKDLEGKVGYDLAKAASLLKGAGIDKGFETEILTSRARGFGYYELAVMLQGDLKKVGINAKISDIEVAQYDSRTTKGDIAIVVHVYSRANLDPASTVTAAKAWFTEQEKGWTHFESTEYDNLRQALMTTLEREKRIPIARKLQELVLDECFTIPVAHSPSTNVYGQYVKGLSYDMDGSPYLDSVWLDR
jgi:ABC-type transport system substrate-binding protein